MAKMSVILGDITEQKADVIVNAANHRMRGGGGVDGAIHKASGYKILEECIAKFPNGLPTGEVGVTGAGDLPAKWVVHAVGPNYVGGQTNPKQLESCYTKAIAAAEDLGAKSIVFPLISAGIYGWPLREAVAIAVKAITHSNTSIEEVRLVVVDSKLKEMVEKAIWPEVLPKVLDAVQVLHERGFQQVRILPGLSASGFHWRMEIGALLRDGWTAPYGLDAQNHERILVSSAVNFEIDGNRFDGTSTVEDFADFIAKKLKLDSEFEDPNYVAWYTKLLELVEAEDSLPIAYWDYSTKDDPWRVGKSKLPGPPEPPVSSCQEFTSPNPAPGTRS